ncbi:MAG: SAM-dependent methyltransferase [Firmicutes bacterium]|nr:SAM-dependent methyltransferase [Bacillota bacterium]
MISLKLKAIAFFIDKSDRVVDIGCDHAYLGIYLKENNLCKSIISSDINENALNNAIINVNKHGLNSKIKCILSDGLNNINTDTVDTIVIAGMGTKTIKEILNRKDKLKGIKKIILSSNNDQYELRKYMQKKDYKLADEKIIFEKNHYYVISKYIKGKQKLSKYELQFGLSKIGKREYYSYLIDENNRILKKIPFTKLKRRHKIKRENRILKKLIKR